jgi:hypothetical protein
VIIPPVIRRAIRSGYRRVFPLPVRPPLWNGTAGAYERTISVVRYGDCSWLAMDSSHDSAAPPGYPSAIAAHLGRIGLGLEFRNKFVLTFEKLPKTRSALRLSPHLDAAPDLVLVQVGGIYSLRRLLPNRRRIIELREDLGRALGRRVSVAYRVLHPSLRMFGRPYLPYRGADPLDDFVRLVEARWPNARIAVMGPLRPHVDNGIFDAAMLARIAADLERRSIALRVDFLDCRLALYDAGPECYCANGGNLSPVGHDLLGRWLGEWLVNGLHEAGPSLPQAPP